MHELDNNMEMGYLYNFGSLIITHNHSRVESKNIRIYTYMIVTADLL